MITRRNFIKKSTQLATGALAIPALVSCRQQEELSGQIQTPNFSLAHKLRESNKIKPIEFQKRDVVIVGGGVSGLSAARWLNQHHVDFQLLELEDSVGGNSRGGANQVSAYPLGAHYLPLPNNSNKDLLSFLEEINLITGYQNNVPIYREEHLCFDPKERLFINHHWQEGLIPHAGIPIADRDEIQKFLARMHDYKFAKGADGRFAFELPVSESSSDPEFLQLDTKSMANFLEDEGYTSDYLKWYVNYCCLDDFGATINDTSAWAGVHYFASRKGQAVNAEHDDVLTWPQGNFWLVQALAKSFKAKIQSNVLVTGVRPENNRVLIDYLDASRNVSGQIEARSVIMATPQFVNQYLISSKRNIDVKAFQYAPWMVANLTISSPMDERRGESLCWDNVIYGSSALGYVHAGHQNLTMPTDKTVITYYKPLAHASPVDQRKQMQQTSWASWADLIFSDLRQPHPQLKERTETLDVFLWGHGMIKPKPGFIWRSDRQEGNQPINKRIYFAHSDLGGISVFEEAFAQGLQAARSVIQNS